MTTAVPAALGGIPDDALVLANRPLAPHIDLAATSRFGDDKWDLSPCQHQAHQNALTINFLTLPTQFRQAAKELCFAMLRNDLPEGEKEMRVRTIRSMVSDLKEFLDWANERGIRALREITADDIDAYRLRVEARRHTANTVGRKRRAVCNLWYFRRKLISDALSIDPVSAWPEIKGPRRRPAAGPENTTDRIPEQVLAPLLLWALRWVEEFADDVIRAQADWLALRERKTGYMGIVDGTTPHERVTALLQEYRATRRPLPRGGYKHRRPPVNVIHLCRQANVDTTTLNREPFWSMITEAIDELGLDDSTYMTTEIRGRLDGQPWLRGIRYDDVTRFTNRLQIACYIVIAYLSGMREAEIKHMKRGCLSVMRDEDGRPVRYKVTSQAFKGEDTPAGTEATWVVSASVATAVRALERLQPPSQDMLFAHPPASRSGEMGSSPNSVMGVNATIEGMARLVKWINEYCAEHGRDDAIPQVNGKDWRLVTKQFRRTLAWTIARQPGGTIAGAIQYRHHSVQMFEGYAGTSASGFRHEVEAEQAIARGEQLGDIILNPAPQRLTGPAAEEAEARLAALENEVQFAGKVITDRKRLARFMQRHDPRIYPGQFVTCVYNPDKALCRRRDGADGPSLPDCQPLKCRNVAITADNAQTFLAWLQRLERALANGSVAPYVRDRMEQRRTELTEFLTTNNIPTSMTKETVR
ncbi:Phage integrase, N-terminal SAM-like domain [Streptomyces sp. DI166]|uniref:site-specific integrase n=1 Tax=Streptomyces sp. DI166 TaxID=1839783 RepID=UPI0007F3D4C7|nr:site-specific integrase [Streptomyces sp. DI166]SBT89348.1 Phage integrase, N-terminal SAM-like domain [Streptomyces sp. DI166]